MTVGELEQKKMISVTNNWIQQQSYLTGSVLSRSAIREQMNQCPVLLFAVVWHVNELTYHVTYINLAV